MTRESEEGCEDRAVNAAFATYWMIADEDGMADCRRDPAWFAFVAGWNAAVEGAVKNLRDEVIRLKAQVVLLKAIRDATEPFLDAPCTCDQLHDQGAICRACLLKERFAALVVPELVGR